MERELSINDLYFLLSRILSTKEWAHPRNKSLKLWDDEWVFEVCRDFQFDIKDKLHILARGHGKTTIHTFGGLIRHILNNCNVTIGLFAITGQVARSFLFQIMKELETNEKLKSLFPDILYWNPTRESPRWSVRDGLIVKRTHNYKNATIEAHGLVDGNYTGARFGILHYDDAINQHTVNTPDMIDKAIKGINLSQACYLPGGWSEFVGTFYSHDDPYTYLIRQGWPFNIQACYEIDWDETVMDEESGLPRKFVYNEDKPLYLSHENIERLKRNLGDQFPIQMMCDPNYKSHEGFLLEWMRYYKRHPTDERHGKIPYILVDPANEKRRKSAYTSMWVIAPGADQNLYVLDGVRKKMDLFERTEALFDLVARWKPFEVRYEKYGMQSDITHIEYMMEKHGYRFALEAVGGFVRKEDRIRRLIPLFRSGRMWFPEEILYEDEDGKEKNLVRTFINEEYLVFPGSQTSDMLDSMSRIAEPEMDLRYPNPMDSFGGDMYDQERLRRAARANRGSSHGWLGA